MPNLLASLTSLFQGSPSEPDFDLDAHIAKTCTKWDVAKRLADEIHAELQETSLNNAEDMPRYQRILSDYADYAIYAALLKRQLDQLMPTAGSDDYEAILDKCYGGSPLREVLMEAVDREMDSEIALLRQQYRAPLLTDPLPSLHEVQHQGTVQPQNTQNMRRAI